MLRRLLVAAAAAALIAYSVGLVLYSGRFPPPGHEGASKRDVLLFVAATLGASVLHIAACVAAHGRPPRLVHILVVAAAVRVLLLFGAPGPVLEGDPSRLRFDARLVNQRVHPYEFTPASLRDEEPRDIVMTGPSVERLVHARAAMTASADAPRPEQVVRPDLRTTATPLALWLGALADRFKPSSTRGFAYLYLVADSVAIFFLVLALRRLCLPVGWVMVYAWCPVLLKEAYCSLAVDALVMPALAMLLWCYASGRRLLGALPLALCGGLRLALLPLFPICGRRVGILGVMLASVFFVVPFLPFQTPDVPVRRYVEGSVHVWRHYEYNSMLENVLRGGLGKMKTEAENSLDIAGIPIIEPGDALHGFAAKVLCLIVAMAVAVYLMIRWGYGTEDGAEAGFSDLFVMLATLLIVSPVLQPCHALWLLPLLAVRPAGLAWISLPALASLSYLTHLEGPMAADLTFLDGDVSFRAVEWGLFVFLLAVDVMFRKKIFPRRNQAKGVAMREDGGAEAALREREPAMT